VWGYNNRKGETMKVNKFWFPIIVIVIFFGTIMVGMATGTWKTENDKTLKIVDGKLDVSSIRGSHRIMEIVKTFHLDKEEFYKTFDLPKDFPPTSKLKDIVEVLREKHPELVNISMNYIREKLDELINKKP